MINNYRKQLKTDIEIEESYEAITLEQEIVRMLKDGTPLENSAPIIYTNRKDGVLPQFDIRTDRFDIALEAMDKRAAAITARRDNLLKMNDEKEIKDPTDDSKNSVGD